MGLYSETLGGGGGALIQFSVDKTPSFFFPFHFFLYQIQPLNDRKWEVASENLQDKLQKTTTTGEFLKIPTGYVGVSPTI